jgi:hypothetical protein
MTTLFYLTFDLTYLNLKIGYANIKLKICLQPGKKKITNIYNQLVFFILRLKKK